MIKTTTINGKEVRYEFKRSHRRRVSAKIRRDSVIEVKAPLLYRESDMLAFLNQHKRWIFNHLDRLQNSYNQEKKYVSGETHYYLGEKYMLQVREGDKNAVFIEDNSLIINVKSQEHLDNPVFLEHLMNKWYKTQAQKVFSGLLPPILEKFKKHNVSPAKISIRNMRSRWGSCSRRGNISLNLQLIKLNENCIRQVMIHEMCHLVYFNHQAGFYALMEEMMPDWKQWKKELKFL
ncbi:MAG: M48 family metallopeptidase [Bacteroidales bacterium]|nr:M48 family metallopeptidase [Bacteroidales bacterium]